MQPDGKQAAQVHHQAHKHSHKHKQTGTELRKVWLLQWHPVDWHNKKGASPKPSPRGEKGNKSTKKSEGWNDYVNINNITEQEVDIRNKQNNQQDYQYQTL